MMLNMRIFPQVLLGALAVLSGCGGDNQDDAGATRLLKKVRADEYRQWERPAGYETRQPTNAPHSENVDIYINDQVVAALTGTAPITEWPVGSTIVKDGFADGDLEIIAIMDKREDGWFWAEYDSDGDAIFSGKPDVCLDCHDSGDDYVRAFNFP